MSPTRVKPPDGVTAGQTTRDGGTEQEKQKDKRKQQKDKQTNKQKQN